MNQHGTVSNYLRGCRCIKCGNAHTEYYRELRARTISKAVAVKQERWAKIVESYCAYGGETAIVCASIAARIRAGE